MSQIDSVREFALAVFRLNRSMIDYGQHLLELDGIKDIQITVGGVLIPLLDKEGQTLSELARNLHMKAPTVTVMANRLEEKGYIRRQRGTEDRRNVRIYLTPSGRKMAEHFRKIRNRVYSAMTNGIDTAKLDAASASLNEVLKNLDHKT